MGLLDVQNTGNGFIGEIGESWSIRYNSTPAHIEEGIGNIGSLSFSARCDATTIFAIDNYLSVKHYLDEQTNRWLSTFDITLSSIETTGEFASFGGNSRIAELDVVRQPSPNPSGTYQRSFEIPAGLTYTISAVTYTIPTNATVYSVHTDTNAVYLLAQGGHAGEVVIQMELGGQIARYWPVYSDATDLASPQSRYLAVSGSEIHVAQVAASRVKRFNGLGTYLGQYGSSGSGNGQFNTIAAICGNNSNVWVLDSALGRIQRFSTTGTYQLQWGATGTGSGTAEFFNPTDIAIPTSGPANIFVADQRGRVREYSQSGTYLSQPAGGYDFTNGVSLGPFAANVPIGVTHDGNGNMYVKQNGHVWKYVSGFSNSSVISNFQVGSWLNGDWDAGSGYVISGGRQGILHTLSAGGIQQYAGSLSSLQAYILYYIALASADFPVRLLTLSDSTYYNVPSFQTSGYPTWRMSVWRALCELCAATGNIAIAFDDFVSFARRFESDVRFTMPRDASVQPLEIDSRSSSRYIRVGNWNATRGRVWTARPTGMTDNSGTVMYSAQEDDQRIFNVDVNSIDYVTVNPESFPEFMLNPVPVGMPTNPFPNPGAESNVDYFSYTIGNGTANLTRGTAAGSAHSGSAYARLGISMAPTTVTGAVFNRADVTPGTQYDFRCWVRMLVGATQQFYIAVDWYDIANTFIGQSRDLSTASVGNTWRQMSFSTPPTAPPGAVYGYVGIWVAATGRLWAAGDVMGTDSYSVGLWDAPAPLTPPVNPGQYTVYDNNGALVDPVSWSAYGASIRADVGENPGTLVLTITGPADVIPGTEAPYRIRSATNTGILTVIGQGITTDYVEHEIGTGIAEYAARSDYTSIESPFIVNSGIAYTEASWTGSAYNPSQRFSFTIRNHLVPAWSSTIGGQGGSSHLNGQQFRYGDAIYIVESVSSNNATTTLVAYRHTPCATLDSQIELSFEPMWNGKTAGEFDAYWTGRPAHDFTMAPLENPFNINADWVDA